jgi:hypothetical protein
MRKLFTLLLLIASAGVVQSQTTLSTGVPSSTTSISGSAPAGLSFTITNSNSYSIDLTNVDCYRGTTSNGTTYTLYYHTTSISGTSNVATTPGWTVLSSVVASTVTTTAIHPTFSGFTLTIPANTTYRFAMMTSGAGVSAGQTTATPTSFTAGGVTVGTGNHQINSAAVGYFISASNFILAGYAWAGTITFAPSVPCITPPTAGTATVSNPNPCLGSSFQLNATGSTGGLGQTYQWLSSPSPTGPYSAVGSAQTGAQLNQTATASLYYRMVVTCSGNTDTTQPVSVTIPAAFPAGTYTINSALPTGSGNFQTFADAAAAINCGTTGPIVFNVAPGTYNNDFFYLDQYLNAPGMSVTINGNGAVLSKLSTNPGNPAIIRLNGTKKVTIDNLKINGISNLSTNYAWGVFLTNNADSNTISNCVITLDTTATSTNYSCVVLSGSSASQTTAGSGCDNNIITNNVFKGGYYCMTLMGNTTTGILQNNTITNNVFKDFYVYGIYASYSNNMKIEGNDIARPTRTSVTTFGPIYLPTGHTNLLVNKNRVHDPAAAATTASFTGYGVYISGTATAAAPNTVSNNLIYNWQGSGTGVHYGFYNSTGGYTRYYHNTVSFDYTPSTTTGLTHGLYQTGTTSGIEFKNNNISITRGGTAAKYGIYMATAANVITSNNNNFYINGAAGINNIGYKTTDQATLGAWQTASAQDANSLTVDPQFASPVAGDYMPTNGALDDMGTPVGVTTDILGATRSTTTPDIGAYEFAVPLCSGIPTAGTAAGPASTCSGLNFTLTLSGYTIGTGIAIQWQSSPAGMNTFTNISGATNSTLITSQTAATDYQAVVTCNNGGGNGTSNIVAMPMSAFYLCYCSPLTGTTLHTSTANYTTNVSIASSSLNNTTSAVGAGGYTFASPSIPSNTTTVNQGVPFTLQATQSTATANSSAWIDWDHSGTFDATEFYSLPKTGLISSLSITPPIGGLTGMTGMRIRTEFANPATFTGTDACTNPSLGRETEDYVINVAPQPTCLPPSGLSASNVTGTTATINWTSSPSAPAGGYDYYVSTSNVAPTATTTPTGNEVQGSVLTNLTNLTDGTTYYVWVRSVCSVNDQSTWAALPSFSTPPVNDECVNSIDITNGAVYNGTTAGATQTMAPCMTGTTVANDVWYSFTTGSVGGSVTVSVVTTGTMDIVLETLSGSCGALTGMVPTASTTLTGTCIDGPAAGTEYGTYTVAPYTTYYARVYGYVSAQGTFTIQATGTPLSIKLANIAATNAGTRNRVDWQTAEEVSGDQFIVERSADGRDFSALTTINAKGQASSYTYWDESPVAGTNYYRLKLMDAAGSASYSKVVTAVVKSSSFIVEAYPNPVKEKLVIRVFGDQGANGKIEIADATGKVVRQLNASSAETTINMTGLAQGIYLVKYSDGQHNQTIKVNKL